MDIKKHITNNLLCVKVTPNASKTVLKEEQGKLRLYLKAVPEKDKANRQMIRFFKKEFNLKVSIKSGARNRMKVLEVNFK